MVIFLFTFVACHSVSAQCSDPAVTFLIVPFLREMWGFSGSGIFPEFIYDLQGYKAMNEQCRCRAAFPTLRRPA